MSYDLRCHDLATHFAADEKLTPAEIGDLAQAIQDAVEEWFAADATRRNGDAWRDPQDWPKPPPLGGAKVRIRVDFGEGENEVDATAYPTTDGKVTYADAGGWCTTSVKAWRPAA